MQTGAGCRAEERLKEAVLMAESFIPTENRRPVPDPGVASSDVVISLFDLHLAAESVIVLEMIGISLNRLHPTAA